MCGFTATKVPGLNLISVQCNGSHLPANARSIQNMVLFHYPTQAGAHPYTIASLSSVDGVVRLENPKILETSIATSSGTGVMMERRRKSDIYVGGRFVMDDAQQTSLSVLLGPSGYGNYKDKENEIVKFECEISYTTKQGRTNITKRFLNVSFAELDNSYHIHPLRSLEGETPKEVLDTPMILLITMAILLFFLFVICVLLIVDRYQGQRRQRQRVLRANRKRGSSCGGEAGCRESTSMGGGAGAEKGEGQGDRPLPAPPSWAYPQVMGVPPKSPYNRLRVGNDGSYHRDDTGYDSDASMHYSRPLDDLGGTTQEKPHLQTFGKHLPPLYATTPSLCK
ncbi:hypothetical protein RRG08_020599 [Elysia crispata]|uniref:Uncharacterized protein n=1 Tax=Elysia crispata TaxID=231223 RepID=A0AAE1A783_9GAST|nr:hypothetical protein RRG08_020599 [Elysia crispata]